MCVHEHQFRGLQRCADEEESLRTESELTAMAMIDEGDGDATEERVSTH